MFVCAVTLEDECNKNAMNVNIDETKCRAEESHAYRQGQI